MQGTMSSPRVTICFACDEEKKVTVLKKNEKYINKMKDKQK
jgi:hypothetical protein